MDRHSATLPSAWRDGWYMRTGVFSRRGRFSFVSSSVERSHPRRGFFSANSSKEGRVWEVEEDLRLQALRRDHLRRGIYRSYLLIRLGMRFFYSCSSLYTVGKSLFSPRSMSRDPIAGSEVAGTLIAPPPLILLSTHSPPLVLSASSNLPTSPRFFFF